MGEASSKLAAAFTRHLKDADATSIESCCKRCGTTIVGSVLHDLRELEEEHLKRCVGLQGADLPDESTN